MDIDAVIEKIKKAVRLARGTTEAGEREAALRLARNLADKNGLAFDSIESQAETDEAWMIVDRGVKEQPSGCEIAFASTLIREHFGVVMMQERYRAYDKYAKPCGWRYSWMWFGTKINIDIARYVFHILIRESRKGWQETRRKLRDMGVVDIDGKADRGMKQSFMRGFFGSIYSRLATHPLRNDCEKFLAEKQAANDKAEHFKQKHNVHEGGALRNRGKFDETAAWLGVEAGDRVSLARPCTDNGQGRSNFLESRK